MIAKDIIALARGAEIMKLSSVTYTDEIMLGYLNLGVLELYKRFGLETAEAVIDLQDNISEYKLPNECMNILSVTDDLEREYPINREDDINSVFTTTWNTIQVPNPETGLSFSIIYNAAPEFVNTVDDTVEIPQSLLEALLHYIGYRAHASQNGNIDGENNTHYTRFEASCTRVLALGNVTPDDVYIKYTTQDKGFV